MFFHPKKILSTSGQIPSDFQFYASIFSFLTLSDLEKLRSADRWYRSEVTAFIDKLRASFLNIRTSNGTPFGYVPNPGPSPAFIHTLTTLLPRAFHVISDAIGNFYSTTPDTLTQYNAKGTAVWTFSLKDTDSPFSHPGVLNPETQSLYITSGISLLCLDAKTGLKTWELILDSLPLGSPVLQTNHLYIPGTDAVYCVHTKTKTLHFFKSEALDTDFKALMLGLDNRLYLANATKGLFAYQSEAYALHWHFKPSSPIETATLGPNGGLYLLLKNHTLLSLSESKGTPKWHFSPAFSLPSFGPDGLLYMTVSHGPLKQDAAGYSYCPAAPLTLNALHPKTGEILSSTSLNTHYDACIPAIVTSNHLLYTASSSPLAPKYIYCFDLNTRTLLGAHHANTIIGQFAALNASPKSLFLFVTSSPMPPRLYQFTHTD